MPGSNLPGQTARERSIRQVIYQASKHMSMGLQLIPEQPFSALDLQFDFPGHITAEYPLPDTGVASRQNITWNRFDRRLEKAQVRFFHSDAAQIRGITQATNKLNIQRAAEAMALQKDHNILDTLSDSVPAGNSAAVSGGVWSDPSAEIEGDLVTAWNSILANSNVQLRVDQNGAKASESIFAVIPAGVWGQVNQTQLINNVQQSLISYVAKSYQMDFFMTRTPKASEFKGTWPLQDKVLMGVEGELTAIHAIYDGSEPSVPLVEEKREHGAGYDYLATQWFTTGVIEDGVAGSDETNRLAEITGVA